MDWSLECCCSTASVYNGQQKDVVSLPVWEIPLGVRKQSFDRIIRNTFKEISPCPVAYSMQKVMVPPVAQRNLFHNRSSRNLCWQFVV